MPRKESPIETELDDWRGLTKRPEWTVYVQLMNTHAIYLQKEVNRCVRNNDLYGAIKFLAKRDEIPKILGKVKDRIKTLEGEGDE